MLLTAPHIGFEGHPDVDPLVSSFELPTQLTQQELNAMPQEVVELLDESSLHPAVIHRAMGHDYRAQIRREYLAQNPEAMPEAEAVAPFVGPMALLAAATFVSDKEWVERLAENRRRASSPFLASEVRKAARAAIPRHLR